jgi:transcriptional antiterminator RfaH
MTAHWYVLQSKPRKEEFLCTQLLTHRFETYFPRIFVETDKLQARKSKPYFRGYLFVYVDLDIVGLSTLQWIPGTIGLVCFGGEPAYISDGYLQVIRHHVDVINNTEAKLFENLKPGDGVIVHSGPFAGYEAIFCARLRDSERAQVLIQALQNQAFRIDLPLSELTISK